MSWRQSPGDVASHPPAEQPRLLMATVYTLPQPFEVLGLVHGSTVVSAGDFATNALLDMLEGEAATLGADAVIGIRITGAATPRASQTRLIGQVTDHYDNVVVYTVLGTAVRWRAPIDAGAT
jgi:hypothetical protein